MDKESLYRELVDAADRLHISVVEQSFRTTGIPVKSGLCKIRGQNLYIMDKHLAVCDKIQLLSECLAGIAHEDHYFKPVVRKLLEGGNIGTE
jgi:hypothetical protein